MSDNKPGANVFTDIEQNTGHTFSIEDDDECIIEDSDDDDDEDEPRDSSSGPNAIDTILGDEEEGADDYDRGDQLPSVEEVKASNAYLPTAILLAKNNRRKIYLAVGAAAVFAMVISIAVSISISVKTSKSNSSNTNSAFMTQKEDRIDKVFTFLEQKNLSPLITLRDPRQPEYRAAEFVAIGDSEDLFAKLDAANPITVQRFAERYILAVVYYATNGDNWADRLNFLIGDHCKWHTIRHTPMGQFLKGVQCDENGRVVDLDLCKFQRSLILFMFISAVGVPWRNPYVSQ